MIFSLPTEARVVKKLYLQCVECIVKNKIKLKTYEHETVIEQNFDLQTLSFVCEIVKKNINQLILFRKLEVFLSLNRHTVWCLSALRKFKNSLLKSKILSDVMEILWIFFYLNHF